MRRFGSASLVLLCLVVVSVLSRARVVFGMDSHDQSLGCVRELDNGVFSVAGSESCFSDDDSAIARLRRVFLDRKSVV